MFKWIKRKLSKNKHKWIHHKSAGTFIEDNEGNISLTRIDKSLLWSVDSSLAVLIRDWLRAFAKDTNGYPPFYDTDGKDNGYENWINKINEIAALFNDYLLDEYWLKQTEDGRKKIATFVAEYDALNITDETIQRFERENNDIAESFKISYIQCEKIKTAMNWLGENWGQLWW